jgi:hypothetical protein
MLIEFAEAKLNFPCNSSSKKACFTKRWQSSKVPSISAPAHPPEGCQLLFLNIPTPFPTVDIKIVTEIPGV